jgi:S1-C subfamily serine protease
VGPVALHDVPINLQQGTSGAYARASFSGTVGQRVLSRFINTWDYGRSMLWLAPGKDVAQPFAPRTSFGVAWLADGPAFTIFTVSAVRKDSPAAAAGFARGDTLVALDGQAAATLRLARVQQALREDGAQHTADVRHVDGRAERLSFTVRTVSIEDR